MACVTVTEVIPLKTTQIRKGKKTFRKKIVHT